MKLLGVDARFVTERAQVLRGAVFLAVIALVVGVLTLAGRGAFASTTDVRTSLAGVGGALTNGADVKYHGVVVGQVHQIAEMAGQVRLELALDSGAIAHVPGNVVSRVLPASIFGTAFVDLADGGAPVGHLRTGEEIPPDRRRATLDMQQLLDGIDGVVKALGPARLATVLDSVASAVVGRGPQLGRLIVQLETLLAKVNPSMPLVRQDLALLTTNLNILRRYGPDLFDATANAIVSMRTLIERQAEFKRLISRTTALSDAGARLLTKEEKHLVDTIIQLGIAVQALYDRRTLLPPDVRSAFLFLNRFASILTSGPWGQVDANLRMFRGLAPYSNADCPSYDGWRGRGC